MPDNLQRINGLVLWNNGKLQFTQPRQLIKRLDQIPLPDRELLNTH